MIVLPKTVRLSPVQVDPASTVLAVVGAVHPDGIVIVACEPGAVVAPAAGTPWAAQRPRRVPGPVPEAFQAAVKAEQGSKICGAAAVPTNSSAKLGSRTARW